MNGIQTKCHPCKTAESKTASTQENDILTVTPRVDILERDDAVIVLADLPGVNPADVDIRFENGELTVHGRRLPGRGDKVNFFRSFKLSEQIAADKIGAELKNGVLTLNLPKVETAKPRRITVNG
ncbi:MAG: Hsp20/alpha crystallin family protein [Gemmataceae bacterium]